MRFFFSEGTIPLSLPRHRKRWRRDSRRHQSIHKRRPFRRYASPWRRQGEMGVHRQKPRHIPTKRPLGEADRTSKTRRRSPREATGPIQVYTPALCPLHPVGRAGISKDRKGKGGGVSSYYDAKVNWKYLLYIYIPWGGLSQNGHT